MGVAPVLEDEYTILWSLSGSDWNALASASGAQSLEVAVTTSLRAAGWGQTPVAPVPGWALKLYAGTSTTAASPVIEHESLASITSFIGSIPNGASETYQPLYEMKSLYLAASEESKSKLLFDFKLLPLCEPATDLILARERWYDASTGTFLTSDPLGATDSTNLYAGFASDPVNHGDPSGLTTDDQDIAALMAIAQNPEYQQAFAQGADATARVLATPQVQGSLQVSAGLVECTAAAALFSAPDLTLSTKVLGYAIATHCADTIGAGLRTFYYGNRQRTLTAQGIAAVAEGMGAAPRTAQYVGDTGDALIGGVGTALGVRSALGLGRAAPIPDVLPRPPSYSNWGSEFADDFKTLHSYDFDMVNAPGPLSMMPGEPAANFVGGRYNAIVFESTTILGRGGISGGGRNAFGQWFTADVPQSAAQVHIDTAVRHDWLITAGVRVGVSPQESAYALEFPPGTVAYVGRTGYQEGIYIGGKTQYFIHEPWNIPGVRVVSETPFK